MKYTCDLGHTNLWSSSETFQQKKKKVAKINITLAGYLFLCGLQFKVFKVNKLCNIIQLRSHFDIMRCENARRSRSEHRYTIIIILVSKLIYFGMVG